MAEIKYEIEKELGYISESDKDKVKRFISKYNKDLKQSDIKDKIFVGDKFLELKGNSMSDTLKINFCYFS